MSDAAPCHHCYHDNGPITGDGRRHWLCCKCHHRVIAAPDWPGGGPMRKKCRARWEEYDLVVDALIAEHGPMGA